MSQPSFIQSLAVRLGTLTGTERLALAAMLVDNFQLVNTGHFSALLQARMKHQNDEPEMRDW